METNSDINRFIRNRRFAQDFEPGEETIGAGGFGLVVKAKHKVDENTYAIKRVVIKSTPDLSERIGEVKILSKVDHPNLINYNDAWVEQYEQTEQDALLAKKLSILKSEFESNSNPKVELNSSNFAVLHIKMELCWFSLHTAINEMKKYFEIKPKQRLPKIAYYMSSELLIEILDAMDYLHNLVPPIIHRDIKPDNILIKGGPNAKFIKICDFGLAVMHNEPELSHTQFRGSIKYMAPEVMQGRRYDTKVDMYSLGVVIQELFSFDINAKDNNEMTEEYKNLLEITSNIMSGNKHVRPTCAYILDKKADWAIGYDAVREEITERIDVSKRYNEINEFVQYFLQTKYKFAKK